MSLGPLGNCDGQFVVNDVETNDLQVNRQDYLVAPSFVGPVTVGVEGCDSGRESGVTLAAVPLVS